MKFVIFAVLGSLFLLAGCSGSKDDSADSAAAAAE